MLRHLFNRFFLGDPYRLGYVQAGHGIARRRSRYNREWDIHIDETKAAQRCWYQTLGSLSSLSVFGAGRLFDFNPDLPDVIKRIVLVDADPKCVSYWQRFQKSLPALEIEKRILEITGKIYPWAHRFREILKEHKGASVETRWDKSLTALASIHLQPVSSFSKDRAEIFQVQTEAVISLNLLSQIPIQWQMWIEQVLLQNFGKSFVEARETEWIKAVRPSCAQLVKEHLILLSAGGAKQALLISDLDYVEYRLPASAQYLGNRSTDHSPSNSATDSTVLIWDPGAIADSANREISFPGSWVRDKEAPSEATAEVFDSLYGIPLENRSELAKSVPLLRIEPLKCWTWHIAPQFREQQQHGYLHRVGAFSITA